MTDPAPIIPISYKNMSGEAVPPHAVLELYTDVDTTAIGVQSVKARKPTGVGPYAIDLGGGAAASGAASYGQCAIPLTHTMHAKFNGTAPTTPWSSKVGPKIGQWYMDKNGAGYWYVGAYSSGDGRLLVSQVSGGGGAQIIRFRIDSFVCMTGVIIGKVTAVMCDGADVAVDDTVDLTDPLGYMVGKSALLINHTGFAVRMHDPDPYTGASCVFEIMSMDDLGYNC